MGHPQTPSPDDWRRLERTLAEHETWPTLYCFKFIVPAEQANHLLALLDGLDPRTRSSRGGRWVSVTCEKVMRSSADVVAVYRRAAAVEGLMAL